MIPWAGLLEQLELQKKLDAQLIQQRNTQSALDLRMHTAGPGPTLHPTQLQRLARHVLIQRGMLQHLLTLLHAYTMDVCSAGQFAQRHFAGDGGTVAGSDEDDCSSFETLVAQQSAPNVPISAAFVEGVPGVDATPLQSSVLEEPMSIPDVGSASRLATSIATETPVALRRESALAAIDELANATPSLLPEPPRRTGEFGARQEEEEVPAVAMPIG